MKDDKRIYGIIYSLAPKFEDKILRKCNRLGLTWLHEGWEDGDMLGTISGPKKKLLKFALGCWGGTPDDAERRFFPLEA